jgi:alpha-1,2-mannosyltransferase
MMKALVAHHDLGSPGGAELVAAATAKSLLQEGAEVELSSVYKFNMNDFKNWFQIDLHNAAGSYLFPFRIDSFAIFTRLLFHRLMKKKLESGTSLGVAWVDMPTYGGLGAEIKAKVGKFIEYIHFPLDIMLNEDMMKEGLLFGETNYVDERYGNPIMRSYYRTYLKYFRKYCRKNPFDYTEHVFANSSWTASICAKLYGHRPKVLNPPISADVRVNTGPTKFEERGDRFVLLGRFTDEKRYHWVIDEVLPLVKNEMPEAEVTIVGSATTKRSTDYIALLRELAERKGFKVVEKAGSKADIRLLTNASRDKIAGIMGGSKVFMHATRNEHWGISVAEAMAEGLPVVIHKSGGAWSDLSKEGEIGEGYDDAHSASKAIVGMFSDKDRWERQSEKSIKRAENLSVSNFSNEFINLIR